MVVLLLWVNTWAGISAGQKIGIDFGPTVTDNWNNVPGNGITEDGDVVDTSGAVLSGISITVADGGFFNNDGADNWMGLGTNGGSAPAEFADSVTTDIAGRGGTPDPFLITVAGLNDSLVYDVVAVCTSIPPYANEETLTINGNVSQSVTRSDTRDNGVFHYLPEVSTDGSGNLALAFTNDPQNNPIVCGILITAIGRGGAGGPTPQNDAQDVLRDTDLTWIPGLFAGTHNIYFGDDLDTVAGATVPTVAGSDVNSFDPGRLEFGKTYYWRVDEVNATPDKTVYAGDVWSFTAEPYSIQVPSDGMTVTASSSSNEFSTPEKTIDGSGLDANDRHGISPETMWFTAAVDLDPWIQYEFDTVTKLDVMTVWNSNGAAESAIGWGVKDVEIATSVDGETWDVLAEANQFSRAPGLPTYDQYDTIDFGGAAAKYVRLNIQSNWGGILMSYGLSEVQFFSIPAAARTPDPASGTGDVLPNAVVTWRSGREAAQHTIYVGTDPNEVANGSATSVQSSVNSLDLSTLALQLGLTYYWRVDEVNEAEATSVWAGPVWDLSTAASLVVDDFESYGNISPNRPFQTWLDGFGYSADEFYPVAYGGNGTGAGIGHDIWSLGSPNFDGSIMETGSTIPGSSQSLPFNYTNTGGVASETQREFAVPQDWTVGQVQTLSIAFRGQGGNTGSLYAKINSTKVVYPRDAANLALNQWQAWNIDLASVGANLESVTTLAIGVEGNGAEGMLLIDDIALHPEAGEMINPILPDNGDPNLVVYYGLDDNADDSTGKYPGTAAGGVTYAQGVSGQAASLNGIDALVDAGDVPVGTGQITVSFWMQPRGIITNWAGIVSKWTLDNTANTFWVGQHANDGWLRFGIYPNGPTAETALDSGQAILTDGQWTHVVCTYDGDIQKIYANGIQVNVSPSRNSMPLVDRGGNLRLGIVATSNWFDGLIDEVRIYDRAVSEGEALGLAGVTTPVDKPLQ